MVEAAPSLVVGRSWSKTWGIRAVTAVACVLFVLSGACGLAYEVVWSKYLGLVLGNSVLVHTAVLGTFMGGMAAGSLWLGRRSGKSTAPLKIYGYLELAIAGYALAFPLLVDAAKELVLQAAGTWPPGSLGLLAVRIGVAVALLTPPTVLMGATFPYLTAHLERSLGNGIHGANWLYAANCTGAVLGTLVTGFQLIPTWGLSATLFGVAIFNAAVGAVALLAGVRDPREDRVPEGTDRTPDAFSEERSEAVPPAQAGSTAEPVHRRLLFAICLSGATAFIYELVWTRLFAITLGSSTYSFTLMLAAFITGLAAGSLVAGVSAPVRRDPWRSLAVAELGIGLAIAISLPLYPHLPYWFWQWRWVLRPVPESLPLFYLFQYTLTFLVMAVPTFLFGLTFPTAIRAAASKSESATDPGSRAAAIYGWNTIGTLLGVTAAGFLLIPVVGLRGSLMVGAVLNGALGTWLWLGSSSGPGSRVLPLALAGATVGILALAPAWHPLSFTYGTFRARKQPPASYAKYRERVESRTMRFYREDQGTTVAVMEGIDSDLKKPQLSLVVDGKADATSLGDMPTQMLLAHLPLIIKPGAREVFVVGLGSGVTAGATLRHPVERVDCAEISQSVADAAETYGEVNGRPWTDPRFRLTIDDGRTVLAASRRKYDLIISEPTNPWISGVGNLFSEEFFRIAADRLHDDGILAQWFHGYELNDALVATILRTFQTTFPYAWVFQTCYGDYVVLGSRSPILPSRSAMRARFAEPAVRDDLGKIHITSLVGLFSLQMHHRESVSELAKDGGVNSDDLPQLEYLAPRAQYVGDEARKLWELDQRAKGPENLLLYGLIGNRPFTVAERQELHAIYTDPRMGTANLVKFWESRQGALR